MQCLLQRNWHLMVRKEVNAVLIEVIYCGTDGEYCARLWLQPQTFLVSRAQWEVKRTFEGACDKVTDLPGLCGVELYFNSGTVLREALSPLPEGYALSLFADAVRAAIQAETFLFQERGYSSTAEYDQYWNTNYLNACRYYSHLDRVRTAWYEHVGIDHRSGNIFNRIKSHFLYGTGDGYRLNGHLNDSFHGVSTDLELAADGATILRAGATLLRVPDTVCLESAQFLRKLEGRFLNGMGKKEIIQLLGGGEGCVHIYDTVYDSMETMKIYRQMQGNRQRQGNG